MWAHNKPLSNLHISSVNFKQLESFVRAAKHTREPAEIKYTFYNEEIPTRNARPSFLK